MFSGCLNILISPLNNQMGSARNAHTCHLVQTGAHNKVNLFEAFSCRARSSFSCRCYRR
ncbi:hypothetical protein CDL12_06890 [Handroanthus impetiginosus]|uniref:Uncharacterized protein n=1 Tax=Handroanthus impetiginosus TaxID=429701 RepID=A0A2G9HSZ4_9LAMI|nr:hypothetical protein CDL12_06890 [Handroanthus impetiginosus]